jgi:hypothetical protein
VQHPNKIELSPVRESQRVQLRLWVVMLGVGDGNERKNMKERWRVAI